jgi:hypothetical protein
MDTSEKNTQMMLNQFSSLRKQLDDLQSGIPKLTPSDPREVKMAEVTDALFCMQLSLTADSCDFDQHSWLKPITIPAIPIKVGAQRRWRD